jgi:hypothetical protein
VRRSVSSSGFASAVPVVEDCLQLLGEAAAALAAAFAVVLGSRVER